MTDDNPIIASFPISRGRIGLVSLPFDMSEADIQRFRKFMDIIEEVIVEQEEVVDYEI